MKSEVRLEFTSGSNDDASRKRSMLANNPASFLVLERVGFLGGLVGFPMVMENCSVLEGA